MASSNARPWSVAQPTDAAPRIAVPARQRPAAAASLPTGPEGSPRAMRPVITVAQITIEAAA